MPDLSISFYRIGIGCHCSKSKALDLIKKSAEQGDPQPSLKNAYYYLGDEGIIETPSRSLAFQKSKKTLSFFSLIDPLS
jgi:hypothetical protein